jgi:hypothetical protein
MDLYSAVCLPCPGLARCCSHLDAGDRNESEAPSRMQDRRATGSDRAVATLEFHHGVHEEPRWSTEVHDWQATCFDRSDLSPVCRLIMNSAPATQKASWRSVVLRELRGEKTCDAAMTGVAMARRRDRSFRPNQSVPGPSSASALNVRNARHAQPKPGQDEMGYPHV